MLNQSEAVARVKTCLGSPKTLGTVLYCLSFGFLGLVLASLGPILKDLAEQTDTDLPSVGYAHPTHPTHPSHFLLSFFFF